MSMMKKYLWLVVINLITGVFCFVYFDYSVMYYCGQKHSKPSLALDLSPSWFNGNFQIRRGYKEIISSSSENAPFFDKWVKGSEKVKTIIAYDVSNIDSVFYFKALGWGGAEKIFFLRKYAPSFGSEYVYEVSDKIDTENNYKWVNVDKYTCREGIYKILTYPVLLLVIAINIFVVFKEARRM